MFEETDQRRRLRTVGADDLDVAAGVREKLVDEAGGAGGYCVVNYRPVNLGDAVVILVAVGDAVEAIPIIELGITSV